MCVVNETFLQGILFGFGITLGLTVLGLLFVDWLDHQW